MRTSASLSVAITHTSNGQHLGPEVVSARRHPDAAEDFVHLARWLDGSVEERVARVRAVLG